jgi:hypothetical protein
MLAIVVIGSAAIHATQSTINASFNQRQLVFFKFQSSTMDFVITLRKVGAPNAGKAFRGARNMYWPYAWCLIPELVFTDKKYFVKSN